MAQLISTFFSALFEKLVASTIEKVGRFVGIESEMKNCEMALFEIRALLDDASHKEIADKNIKDWLNRLQSLAYDIDDVLDELAYEAMRRELAEEDRSLRSKVRKLIPVNSTRLNNITNQLQELEKEKVKLGLFVTKASLIKRTRNYETSWPDADPVVGRQGETEALLDKLLGGETCNQNFNIVPIVGMGGMGKTSIARLLYNETRVKERFELRAWVCVSDGFDIFRISKSIFASVKGEDKEFADLNQLQEALGQLLMRKQFLLVLDDVWSDSDGDWGNLVRPLHAMGLGSKIIMTTRKKELLSKLSYTHLYTDLPRLSYDDALALFSQHALGVDNLDSHPTLRLHGEGIVAKCDGLPLALKALGRLLSTKADEAEWKQLLNSEIWSLQKEDKIVPALKLSYHDLSACLKQLFAYRSLFPKDYMFDKEDSFIMDSRRVFAPVNCNHVN